MCRSQKRSMEAFTNASTDSQGRVEDVGCVESVFKIAYSGRPLDMGEINAATLEVLEGVAKNSGPLR